MVEGGDEFDEFFNAYATEDDADEEDFEADEDFHGFVDIGTLPRDDYLDTLPENHRRCFFMSQADCIGALVQRYGQGQSEPMVCAYAHGESHWLNGCRAALRRFYETASRISKDDPDFKVRRLYLHYQNSMGYDAPRYRTMEMWLSERKSISRRHRGPGQVDDIIKAFGVMEE